MEKVEQTECAEIFCDSEIGPTHWRKGHKKYCSLRCMAIDMGAVEITTESEVEA